MNRREFLRDYDTLISVLSPRVVWESEASLCVTENSKGNVSGKFEKKCWSGWEVLPLCYCFFSRSRNQVNRWEMSQVNKKCLRLEKSSLSLSGFVSWTKKRKNLLTKKPVGPDLITITESSENSLTSTGKPAGKWFHHLGCFSGNTDWIHVVSVLIWV